MEGIDPGMGGSWGAEAPKEVTQEDAEMARRMSSFG